MSEDLCEKYKKILISNGINDNVADVTVHDSGAKGDGMASLTQRVTVTFENPNKPPLNLFVKLRTGNPSHEVMLNALQMFEKEAEFFMEYIPVAKKFCESKGMGNLLDIYPKCYYGDAKTIVLENLIERGYELLPHEERHDYNTACFALKTIAKYHAMAHAVVQECGGGDKFCKRFVHVEHNGLLHPMMVKIMGDFFEDALRTGAAILKANKTAEGVETIEKLTKLTGKTFETFAATIKFDDGDLRLLTHGDYKNNNMMVLRDKDTKVLKHVMAIDMQGICFFPPVLDVLYYLFTSVDPKVRQTRYHELLNVYRDTLNNVTRDLGYPLELSYEDLLKEYRKRVDYGYLMAMTLVGPGMGLIKSAGIDVTTIDMAELGSIFHQCLNKYIKENPDKGMDMAEEVINLVKEHDSLKF